MTPIELSRLTGTSVHTIRFYARIGLLRAPRNRANGYREYSSRHASLLLFIRQMRGLGLSLADVRGFLGAAQRPHGASSRLRGLVAAALPVLDKEIATRLALQRMLRSLHRRSASRGSISGEDVQRLIASLAHRS